jgi:uncharacterized protein YjiS (DUF1127 family)
MICKSRTRTDASGTATTDAGRPRSSVAGGILSVFAKGWQAYWNWRVKRTTVLMLRSLDRRTLRDIGVDPSEIVSLVHDAEGNRRHRLQRDPCPRASLRTRWMNGQ